MSIPHILIPKDCCPHLERRDLGSTRRTDGGNGGGELAASGVGQGELGDARLNRRLVRVAERLGRNRRQHSGGLRRLGRNPGAYRLLAHEEVAWEAVLTPHWDCSIKRMRGQPVVLCVQDSTELNYTSQPGIAGLGPLSDLRQHGLYVHPTLAVTPDGVPLGCWMPGCGRATGRPSAKTSGIGRSRPRRACAGWKAFALRRTGGDPARHPPDLRRRPECDIHEFMVRARREPGIDWLIRATHDRCLAEGDKLWSRLAQAPLLGEVALPSGPAEPTEPAGGADGAGRTGHLVA